MKTATMMNLAWKITFSALSLVFCFEQDASAQALLLKDGNRVPAEDFKVEGGKIIRTVKLQGTNTATTVLATSNIAELDWPYSAELTESRSLLSQGKTEEAIAVLKTGKEFFEAFKDVKGGGELYRDVFFGYVEALAQGGKFDETIGLMPTLQKLSLNKEQEVRLKVLKLNIERQTSSDYVGIIAQANNILTDTDDSGISAAVWDIIGDIHDKKKEYDKALMAYLRIPVFFGTQMQRVPAAELKAAKMLIKMRRFEDATAFLTRLVESYPGSAVADTAAKEKASINGMKNEEGPAKPADEKASQS
jgi:tetratricopeptide (TPR) repeat protein